MPLRVGARSRTHSCALIYRVALCRGRVSRNRGTYIHMHTYKHACMHTYMHAYMGSRESWDRRRTVRTARPREICRELTVQTMAAWTATEVRELKRPIRGQTTLADYRLIERTPGARPSDKGCGPDQT